MATPYVPTAIEASYAQFASYPVGLEQRTVYSGKLLDYKLRLEQCAADCLIRDASKCCIPFREYDRLARREYTKQYSF
jgi:hypothetical protein